ncbi:MAG: FAD-binding oxidoreductase [Pseudomonadota bacterium]
MGYLTANDTPGEHAESWYAATAGEIPDRPALGGEIKADVCVIGGGYAGLSAALHLAEQGVDVVLLDANRVGWGASGRNGGQLGIGPRADITAYEKAIGKADARRVWDIALAANQLVRDLIGKHAIACDLRDGYLEAAYRPSETDELHEWVEHLRDNYDHRSIRAVTPGEMGEMLGTTAYHGGYLDMAGAHLHPLKLALGYARAAEASGARLFERSRALRVSPGRVDTDGGVVRADHILLALNGYIDRLVPAAARRTIAINNFVAATEPLGENRARQIIRDPVCVCDTKFVLNYYRFSPDNRLIWGGGESYGKRFPADIERIVRPTMLKVFPQLSDVAFTHAWGGTLAITAPRFPVFENFDNGIWSIAGWSGSGIHMAAMGGKIAAEAIRGEMTDWTIMSSLPVPPFPGGAWFRAPLVAAAMTWYSLRDRL